MHIAFSAHLIAIGKLALDVFSTMDSCHLEIPSYGSALLRLTQRDSSQQLIPRKTGDE